MSYRIEISPSNRAACRREGCTWNGGKIAKGELRLAQEIQYVGRTFTGWAWRHWGCVSVVQIANIQTAIKSDEGIYDWDRVKGYGGLGEQQEKFRSVIVQGHVDPEDLRADPEWKTLGNNGSTKTSESNNKHVVGDKGTKELPWSVKAEKYHLGTPYGRR